MSDNTKKEETVFDKAAEVVKEVGEHVAEHVEGMVAGAGLDVIASAITQGTKTAGSVLETAWKGAEGGSTISMLLHVGVAEAPQTSPEQQALSSKKWAKAEAERKKERETPEGSAAQKAKDDQAEKDMEKELRDAREKERQRRIHEQQLAKKSREEEQQKERERQKLRALIDQKQTEIERLMQQRQQIGKK